MFLFKCALSGTSVKNRQWRPFQYRARISRESRESTRLGTRLKSFCASYPGLAQNYTYNSTMCICLLGWPCLFSVQRNSHQCACPVLQDVREN